MPGFGPLSSTPVSALPSGGSSGTTVTPLVGSVTIVGLTPTVVGVDPISSSNTTREVLLNASGQVVLPRVTREVLRDASAPVFSFLSVREVLRDPQTITIFEYAVVREVLRDPEPSIVNSFSAVREVLRQGFPLTSQSGSISILW